MTTDLIILTRYQETCGVEIYAFCLMGNHYHLLARFPKGNRVRFQRDFNSIISRALLFRLGWRWSRGGRAFHE